MLKLAPHLVNMKSSPQPLFQPGRFCVSSVANERFRLRLNVLCHHAVSAQFAFQNSSEVVRKFSS